MKSQPRDLVLDGEAEQLYRHLLRSPAATLEDHAVALGWTLRRAQRLYRDLEREHHCTYTTDGNMLINGDLG